MRPTPKPATRIEVHPEVIAMAKRMGYRDPVKGAIKAAVGYVRRNVEGGTGIGPAAYALIEQEEKRGAKRG